MITPKEVVLNHTYNGGGTFTLSVMPVESADYLWQKCKIRTTQWADDYITTTNAITITVDPVTDIGNKFRCLIKVGNKVICYSKALLISKDLFIDNGKTGSQYANGNYQYNQKSNNSENTSKKHEPSVRDTDGMEGHQFEYYCANILRKNGFTNVAVTQASGDFGVDITAVKDSITYAIQCKSYSGVVGNDAVQEVYSGKAKYKCIVAVVLTNSYFTKSAKETAEFNSVVLWDRDYLDSMIKNAYSAKNGDQAGQKSNQKERSYQQHKETNTTKDSNLSFFKGCDTWEQVRERYRNLMKTYHPDSGSGDMETSQEINSQYEQLKRKFGQ